MQCNATTKLGHRCKHPARAGSEFCAMHDEGNGVAAAVGSPRSATAAATKVRGAEAQCTATCDDPFAAIADAMSSLAAQIEADEQRAGAKPAARPPHTGASQAIYSAAYCLGFGVAFPMHLGLGLLPENSAAARGLSDGARDAKDKARRMRNGK